MTILPKPIDRLNMISIKIPEQFFPEVAKRIFNFLWKQTKISIAKTVLTNKRPARGITIPDFKLSFGVIVIKIA